MFELMAVISSDSLESSMTLGKNGIFSDDQITFIFSHILKFLEITVSQGGSPYTLLDDDMHSRQPQEKMKTMFDISKLIIFSMSGEECLEPGGIMEYLEILINSIETFFHPSNNGSWTYAICYMLDMLVQHFLYRWNTQKTGDYVLMEGRYVTAKVKDRFVKILRSVAFMSIHSKSSTASSSGLNALNGLAYLSPDLIIPFVLKEVYPSLQGVVETHRTMTSLKALSGLARTISQTPRYAIHLSTLLNLTIPGIDTNDPSKTFQSLSFIQAVALNVPFWDLSGDVGSGLAMQYLSNDVAYLEQLATTNDFGENSGDNTPQLDEFQNPITGLPEYEPELLQQIWNSSTYCFSEFVSHFLERVFRLIENLPDPSVTKSRATQESNVVAILAPTFSAVMAALPPDLYDDFISHILDFITNNVYYSACDAIALICSNVVRDNPKVSFPRFFEILKTNIEQEILENGAGSTRSGSEILPRDRTLIWYLGILNMSLAHAGPTILNFKDELMDLTMFLRQKCKGSIVYHISNTVHHTLMSLSTISIQDYGIVPNRFEKKPGIDITTKNWGEVLNCRSLDLQWRVPNREEVEFAIGLFESHVEKSFESINEIISEQNKGATVTEISDILSSNLTYLRTATSGISYLFDPNFKEDHPEYYQKDELESTENGNKNSVSVDNNSDMSEDEAAIFSEGSENPYEIDDDDEDEEVPDETEEIQEVYPDADVDVVNADELEVDNEIMEFRKLRQYPTGYFFSSEDRDNDPLYIKLHLLHIKIGRKLNLIHEYLLKNRESDISTFKALLFAYKVYFADVGVERTAKLVESLSQIFTFESNKFRLEGLRKPFPRALLAKRALLYHNARIYHNNGPRRMMPLDKIMLNHILLSSVSIYPDISRNAQSSLESCIKSLSRSRAYAVDWIIDDVSKTLVSNDLLRAESGLRVLGLRILQSYVKKNFGNASNFAKVMNAALKADKLSLNNLALSLLNTFSESASLPFVVNTLNLDTLELIRPKNDVSAKIAGLIKRQQTKKTTIVEKVSEFENILLKNLEDRHWKITFVNLSFLTLFLNNENPFYRLPVDIMKKVADSTLQSHPGVQYFAINCMTAIISSILNFAEFGYDVRKFSSPGNLKQGEFYVDSSEPGFTEKFLAEMQNWDNPSYFVDDNPAGYLVWPKKFIASKVDYQLINLSESDLKMLGQIGQFVDLTWFSEFLKILSEERGGREDYVSQSMIIMVSIYFSLIDMGLTKVTIEDVKSLIDKNFDVTDKNSHRCYAIVMGAMLIASSSTTYDIMQDRLQFVSEKFENVVMKNLTRDVLGYWKEFLVTLLSNLDFRRIKPLIKYLVNFEFDPYSSSLFKETSRLTLLQECYMMNWAFMPPKQFTNYLWDHLDYPKKGVCTEIGAMLADFESSYYHESFPSVDELLQANRESGDLGREAFELSPDAESRIRKAFEKLESLRIERNNSTDHSSVSPYVLAATTISEYLHETFIWSSGVGQVKLLSSVIIPALLHFFSISEEATLSKVAISLFRKFSNVPCPKKYLQSHIDAVVIIASSASNWHQRYAMLIYIQGFYFRQLFMMNPEQRRTFALSTAQMLNDSQLEVRELAAETLSGIIRCSPIQEQAELVRTLSTKFTDMLHKHKFPKSRRLLGNTPLGSGTSTPSVEYQQIAVKRHAAVLGLGALVSAFPYKSPPPKWVPQILATLSVVASDPGMVGKSVKTLLGDFKNTRTDTWHIDSKAFTHEQLEDLEGVLWKNYFV